MTDITVSYMDYEVYTDGRVFKKERQIIPNPNGTLQLYYNGSNFNISHARFIYQAFNQGRDLEDYTIYKIYDEEPVYLNNLFVIKKDKVFRTRSKKEMIKKLKQYLKSPEGNNKILIREYYWLLGEEMND